MSATAPSGVYPFFMADNAAEKYGLKNGKDIIDLIRRKTFKTTTLLQEIKMYGFMCAFEPCQKQLQSAKDLDEVVVVCDTSSKYGEMFLLLHTAESIASFVSPQEEEEKRINDEEARRAADLKSSKEGRIKKQYVEMPIIPKVYESATINETIEEVDELCDALDDCFLTSEFSRIVPQDYKPSKPKFKDFCTSIRIDPKRMDQNFVIHRTQDLCVQAIPTTNSKNTQTTWIQKTNKAIQWESIGLADYNIQLNDVWCDVAKFLHNVSPIIEQTLQQNETIDIFTDYFENPTVSSSNLNIAYSEDEKTLMESRKFIDLDFTKGMNITNIQLHPKLDNIFAVSAINPDNIEMKSNRFCQSKPAFIIFWDNATQETNASLILKAPVECPVFSFNPTNPNIIVGGCTNGHLVIWDTNSSSKKESHVIEGTPITSTNKLSTNNGNASSVAHHDTNRRPMEPFAVSSAEHGHKRMVTDIQWLSPKLQINARGQLLPNEYLSDETFQFFSVSGDGQVIFWDIRYDDIMMGKLPHIAKVKVTKQQQNLQDLTENHSNWSPIFKIKPKRLEGTGELSFCKATLSSSFSNNDTTTMFQSPSQSGIICTSEEGELLCVDWLPKSHSSGESETIDRDFASQEYVKWMKKDHNRPCISLSISKFFPEYVLTVCDWNFHIWHVDDNNGVPIITSPFTNCHLTGGLWSPTRPSLVFISKANGSIDVWDFTDSCYFPCATFSLIPNRIMSMSFLQCGQKLAVGDSVGSLHLFELPSNLTVMYSREKESTLAFFTREVKRSKMNHDNMVVPSTKEKNNSDGGVNHENRNEKLEPEAKKSDCSDCQLEIGLSEEEEDAYQLMEKEYRGEI